MEVASCPDPLVWQQYALGLVEEAEQKVLEAHLAHCPTCLERLGQLPAEDTLLADLRVGLTVADRPPDAAVDQVIRSATELCSSSTRVPSADQGAAEAFDFLAPAQEAGEIGRLADFRVLQLLGRGGMGLVFLAEDTQLRRRVALKVLSPKLARRWDASERFLREARAAAAIRHHHVVTIYQVGAADSPAGRVPFLAMELLEGASLEATLAQAPLTLADVVRVGREVAEGLAAAHESGLIHRDVKPDNIFLERAKSEGGKLEADDKQPPGSASSFRVKLLDFGLARAMQLETALTESGVAVGTPAYMAPEQAAGQPVDARTDLFSLGCVLYRLCTGRPPFPGSDVMAILTALALQEPIPIRQANPAVPPALADVIDRLLAKDPAARPASAREVVALLDDIEGRPVEATRLPPPAAPRPRPGGPFLPLALVALAALGVLVALAMLVVRVTVRTGEPAEFLIDTDDPTLVFRVNGKGGVILEDRKAVRRYLLKVGRHDPATGEYEIDVSEAAGLHFSTKMLTIKRGERVALKASVRAPAEPPLPAGVTGIDRAWVQKVARLPAAEQHAAVTTRLKELNPGFEGPVTPTIENGVVVGLEFQVISVTNLAPVRGLPGLHELKCHATGRVFGRLTDLAPLAGLPLRVLSVKGNPEVSDLRPLAGMPLEDLNCYGTRVADLTPLAKCPLKVLNVGGTRVRNLAALKTLPLKRLIFADSLIDDLGPLAGVPLQELSCAASRVSDLGPLRKMPLTIVNVRSCSAVKDLTPLHGMPLDTLDIRGATVTDLTPLKGAPLRRLWAHMDQIVAHRQLLQALPKLVAINDAPVQQFWAKVDARRPGKGP